LRLLSPAPKRIAVSGAVIVICLVAQLILLTGSRLTGRHRPATRQRERPATATRQAPVTVSLDRAAVS
jgi:hypothetical protein